jgi:hypothetical protein
VQEQDEPTWVRSPFSGGGTNCVEVARLADGQVGLRNSRDLSAPAHTFTQGEWEAFVTGIKHGCFDGV